MGKDDLPAEELELLDEVASRLTAEECICSLFGHNPQLKVPSVIVSYTEDGGQRINLNL